MAQKLNRNAFNDWIYNIINDYSARIEVYVGGAGSGKSYGACQKVLLKAMNDAQRKTLVIRKVGTTIKHSIWALFLDLLSESGMHDGCYINRSDFEFKLCNGAHFIFKSLDDREKIKSITGITDIMIEEASEITLDDFTQLNLRLRPPECIKNPQIYLMYNPVSKSNWVFSRFHNPKTKALDNVKLIQTNYLDNRFLTKEYIAELERLKQINPAYYRIYALGEFATLDKLVYPIYQKRLISEDEVRNYPLFVAVDFGYTNDPTALVKGRYDGTGKRIFITGEYYKTGMTNDVLAEVIKQLGLAKEVIIADSAEPKSIDELRKLYGIRRIKGANKGADSVLSGIQFIQQHELIVDERCVHYVEELENYTWEKDRKTGEYINRPIDAFNHLMDATRYGTEQYIKGSSMSVLKPKRMM